MSKKISITLTALGLLLGFSSAGAATREELAFHYAPVHYQDTASADYRSDYITAFDYDYDMNATNNWDNRGDAQWPATVYYSVVESCSHYFITYAFYHPRDWSNIVFDQEHENDLEGALMMVRKNGSDYGALEGMITVFHNDFYSYTPAGSPLTNGNENIDGTLSFESHNGVNRVKTVQETRGHGLKAWPYASDFDGSSDQDGIIYYPTEGAAEYPDSGNDRYVAYRLVDINAQGGLWPAALQEASLGTGQGQTYHTWGTFRGDKSGGCGDGWQSCSENSANTPWGWDDHDDGGSYRGEFALDPAHLFDHYFDGLGQFSQQYVYNPFLKDLLAAGYSSTQTPNGFPSQLDLNSLYGKLVSSCSQ